MSASSNPASLIGDLKNELNFFKKHKINYLEDLITDPEIQRRMDEIASTISDELSSLTVKHPAVKSPTSSLSSEQLSAFVTQARGQMSLSSGDKKITSIEIFDEKTAQAELDELSKVRGEAQFVLWQIHYYGINVNRDPIIAATWLHKAIQNNPSLVEDYFLEMAIAEKFFAEEQQPVLETKLQEEIATSHEEIARLQNKQRNNNILLEQKKIEIKKLQEEIEANKKQQKKALQRADELQAQENHFMELANARDQNELHDPSKQVAIPEHADDIAELRESASSQLISHQASEIREIEEEKVTEYEKIINQHSHAIAALKKEIEDIANEQALILGEINKWQQKEFKRSPQLIEEKVERISPLIADAKDYQPEWKAITSIETDSVENELKLNEKKFEELVGQKKYAEEQIRHLEDRRRRIEKEIADFEESLEEYTQRIDEGTRQLAKLNLSEDDKQISQDIISKRIEAGIKQVEQTKLGIQERRAAVRKIEEEREHLHAEISRINAEIDRIKNEGMRIRKKLDRIVEQEKVRLNKQKADVITSDFLYREAIRQGGVKEVEYCLTHVESLITAAQNYTKKKDEKLRNHLIKSAFGSAKKAADRGNAHAAALVTVFYYEGLGVQQNRDAAQRYFRIVGGVDKFDLERDRPELVADLEARELLSQTSANLFAPAKPKSSPFKNRRVFLEWLESVPITNENFKESIQSYINLRKKEWWKVLGTYSENDKIVGMEVLASLQGLKDEKEIKSKLSSLTIQQCEALFEGDAGKVTLKFFSLLPRTAQNFLKFYKLEREAILKPVKKKESKKEVESKPAQEAEEKASKSFGRNRRSDS